MCYEGDGGVGGWGYGGMGVEVVGDMVLERELWDMLLLCDSAITPLSFLGLFPFFNG